MVKKRAKPQQITVGAESADLPEGYGSDEALRPELLSAVDIGEMYLYCRQRRCGYGVTDCDAGMGICSRIYQYAGAGTDGGLDFINESPFGV